MRPFLASKQRSSGDSLIGLKSNANSAFFQSVQDNMSRLDYAASIAELKRRRFLGADERPALLRGMPSPFDEEPLGVSFFRTRVEGDLSGLSLPRTFISRSEVRHCSLAGTDLGESFLCWNDFTDVDFSAASLRGADLRASIYTRVMFCGADLSSADLRGITFKDCDFTDAVVVCRQATCGRLKNVRPDHVSEGPIRSRSFASFALKNPGQRLTTLHAPRHPSHLTPSRTRAAGLDHHPSAPARGSPHPARSCALAAPAPPPARRAA
jgi:BTB/POZ domain-containing protein KCTD9